MRSFLVAVTALLLATQPVLADSPPKPAKSKYLKTTGAGFLMSAGNGVQYGMNYELRKSLAEPLYIVATFDNPADATVPLRAEVVVQPGARDFQLQSPFITVITHDTKYKVVLELFSDAAHTQLIGTHEQLVLFSVPPAYEAMLEEKMGMQIQ
ncbi:MAG: hypothetical protein NAOJABEB_00759 [Steroidobacteraceae bacterium]|nr:hypothetical protein [Steroidobacteraceae bacterium]